MERVVAEWLGRRTLDFKQRYLAFETFGKPCSDIDLSVFSFTHTFIAQKSLRRRTKQSKIKPSLKIKIWARKLKGKNCANICKSTCLKLAVVSPYLTVAQQLIRARHQDLNYPIYSCQNKPPLYFILVFKVIKHLIRRFQK